MNRRNFLGAGLGLGAAYLGAVNLLGNSKDNYILYSASTTQQGQHGISALNQQGEKLFTTKLPARAHGVSKHPLKNEIAVCARRPGTYIIILDALTGEIKEKINTKRSFFGHGVYSADGKYVFTTENDIENTQGLITVRDTQQGYRLVSSYPSAGIGPHELHFLSDNKTLVVANGGILTRPDTGRERLNLDTMRPSLAYIDAYSGKLIDDYRLDEKYFQLSIRHLDVNSHDDVCFAMQYQGRDAKRYPLVGFHRGESELQLTEAPKNVINKMRNYCGSVCTDRSGEYFAVSSPRGNLVTLWQRNGDYLGRHKIMDGCGIAPSQDVAGFNITNGSGELHRYVLSQRDDKKADTMVSKQSLRWDNHLEYWQMKS